MIKRILLITSFITFLISCDKKQTQNDSTILSDSLNVNHSKVISSELLGTYKGDISCDDCESVILTLKDSSTYLLTIQLSAEEQTENSLIKEKGYYKINEKDSILTLDKFDLHFKIGKKKLYFLDHTSKIDEHEVLNMIR